MAAKLRARESDILESILQYLVMRGALVLRINSGGMRSSYKDKERYVQFVRFPDEQGLPDEMKKSCSDILALHKGVFYGIECKREGEKPTRKQGNFLAAVERCGGVAIIATSIEDVQKGLC